MKSARDIRGLLYDGILSAESWNEGMDALKDAVGSLNFHQLTIDVQRGVVLESICSATDAQGVENYERHYALADERVPALMQLGQGQIMLDHEHFDARHISRSALYSDCLASMGMKHTMALMLRVENGVHQYVGFMRQLDRPHFSNHERDFAQRLMPDLTRATQLRDGAGHLARRATLGLAALDSLRQGIAVVDAQCCVHYANAAMERLIASPRPLHVRKGRIGCVDDAVHAQLLQLATAACARPARAGALILQGDGAQQLAVAVLPLQARHAWASVLRQAPMALIVATKPGALADLDHSLVGEMLGLSPTEARLALLLVAGKTLKDFAVIQGCTWNTARSHLTNLLGKTGCRRQVELVQLLQALQGV